MSVRVRIAPSPTGMMHVGTARTALFNWLFAKKNDGIFILRIEDTDKERSKREYEENIIDGLEWLGLDYQEFYRQSERVDVYQKYIKELLKSGSAFYCYHTKEELENERESQAEKKEAPRHACGKRRGTGDKEQSIIRFTNPGGKIKFTDIIRGEIEFDAELLGDFSIAKDEDTPLYNLAAALDDSDMRISHVIRGEDHISNTPKQILVLQALGLNPPQYAHLPMILGTDKSKLSKRHGATALTEYREMGYLPDPMFNFLTFIGWSPQHTARNTKHETNEEIMTRGEITEHFSLEAVQKSGAVFNIEKLDWMNGEYIRKMPLDELVELCKPYLPTDSDLDLKKIVALEQSRMKKISEIGDSTEFFFKDKLKYDKQLLRWKDMREAEVGEILGKLEKLLNKISDKDYIKEKLEKILMPEAEKMGDRGKLLWPLRVALTAQKASPSPFEVAEVLGKEKSLTRIREAKELMKATNYKPSHRNGNDIGDI